MAQLPSSGRWLSLEILSSRFRITASLMISLSQFFCLCQAWWVTMTGQSWMTLIFPFLSGPSLMPLSESLLVQAPDSRHRALVLSTSIPHSGDWLKAIPSSALNLHFFEFRICLQYWLGVSLTSSSHSCFICTRPCDPLGDHAVGCGGNGDRILRHNALRDVLHSVAQYAGLSPRTEVPALIPDSSSHPADLFLPHWQGGRPAVADVTVISPMQVLTLQGASTSQGSAIVVAEERKRALYSDACRSESISSST